MDNFWKGTFAPSKCAHGDTSIIVGEPEFGTVPVYVQFNHTCSGRAVPSNSTTYTFEYELDDFTDGEQGAAQDLQAEVNKMSDKEKLKWVNDQLSSGETLDIPGTFW